MSGFRTDPRRVRGLWAAVPPAPEPAPGRRQLTPDEIRANHEAAEWVARHTPERRDMPNLADEIQPIRAAYEAKAALVKDRLRALDADDGRDPAWKAEQRAKLHAEFRALHDKHRAVVDEWERGVRVQAAAMRSTEPEGDAAEENRRLRDQLRIRDLADSVDLAREAVAFLDQARAMLALGNVREAAVYAEAAKRKNAPGWRRVHDDLQARLDEVVPHRAEARQLEREGARLHTEFRLRMIEDAREVGTGLVARTGAAGYGNPSEVAAAGIQAKMLRYASDPDGYREDLASDGVSIVEPSRPRPPQSPVTAGPGAPAQGGAE